MCWWQRGREGEFIRLGRILVGGRRLQAGVLVLVKKAEGGDMLVYRKRKTHFGILVPTSEARGRSWGV